MLRRGHLFIAFVLLESLALNSHALADDDSARSARREVVPLARVGKWDDALVIANLFVKTSPSAEWYFLRAGLHVGAAKLTKHALENVSTTVDYATAETHLNAAIVDLRRYRELAPDAMDSVQVEQEVTSLTDAANKVRTIQETRAVERLTKEQDEMRRRVAAAQDEHDARVVRRIGGIALVTTGLVSFGAMATFAYLGAHQNSVIQNGGLATSADIASAANIGATFNIAFVGTLIGGIVLTAVGLPLTLLNLGSGRPDPKVSVSSNGLSIAW